MKRKKLCVILAIVVATVTMAFVVYAGSRVYFSGCSSVQCTQSEGVNLCAVVCDDGYIYSFDFVSRKKKEYE